MKIFTVVAKVFCLKNRYVFSTPFSVFHYLITKENFIQANILRNFVVMKFILLSTNPTKWSNTLKQFVDKNR